VCSSDLIEWIGEALDFLKVASIQEQAVAFLEVKDYQADMPQHFHAVLQIARNNYWSPETKEECNPCAIVTGVTNTSSDDTIPETMLTTDDCGCGCKEVPVITDCRGFIYKNGLVIDYQQKFDVSWDYPYWTSSHYYKRNFTPVRLANNTLFNSLVCKEVIDPCIGCTDEYTIVGSIEKKLRFSFKEGQVALAYLKNSVDLETGYPLVPDQISYITAITYYIQWKVAQMLAWNGREGFGTLSMDKERLWLKYAAQAKSFAKMPKGIDDHQDLLEQSHYLIPDHKKYYSYFGNLGKSEQIHYNSGRYGNY
jgi:hypothetical protein